MTTAIVPLYAYFNKDSKSFWNITRIAKERSLCFSDKEEFEGNVLALDKQKRKLLFLMKSDKKQSCLIVDLKDLIRCTIKKQYRSIKAGDLKNNNLQEYLKSILLCLRFKNSACDVPIPFFEATKNKQEDVFYLEARAIAWKSLVSACYQPSLVQPLKQLSVYE